VIGSPLLVRWYGIVATVAGVLAVQAIVMPRWPATPAPLPKGRLEASLREQHLLPSSDRSSSPAGWPARRSYELSTSAPVIMDLQGGYELLLMAGTVRQRFNLQSSFIGRDQPRLNLKRRHLLRTPTPSAAGRIQEQPALQTCMVRGAGLENAFGVTRTRLTTLNDRLAKGSVSALERIIGLRPNRTYGCTLISLRGPRGTQPSERLWEEILNTVEPVLRSPG
jgi:hypothetical protein